ncbi:MAG: Gfo/Idh/MocA family oxidoreductase [Defluviitaleaceae bacterium]|nr:Gfo/Idh/MocA family oxidoreductase [Defluviitaleaceae bacterium]
MKKAAIIGLGNIAPMHIKSLEAIGVEITAVCDKQSRFSSLSADNDNPCDISKLLAKTRFFTDYKKMLDAGGFDVLHICLPHHLHAPVAVAALEKGIHVLCEKPMATTVSDAESMVAAAEKSGAVLGIVFQNRYSPGAALIKETLESGELGAVLGGWLRVTWFRDDSYYTQSDWRGKKATEGGGVLINQSIHTFDMLNYFLGSPTAVSASVANRAHPLIEVEDVAEGVITYGCVSEDEANPCISFFVNTYHPYDAPADIEIICKNGRAKLTGEDAEISFNDGRKKTAGADTKAQRQFGMKSYWGVSHVKQIKAFYEAISCGKTPQPDGMEGFRTQRLINGIYKSAETGEKVDLQT